MRAEAETESMPETEIESTESTAATSRIPAAPSTPKVAYPADGHALIEAVQADLRKRVTVNQIRLLQEYPTAWLGTLRTLERDMMVQIETRNKAIEVVIERGSGHDWDEVLRKHNAWSRKVSHALRKVRKRISEVQREVPEAALRQAVQDLCNLDPYDHKSIAAWQIIARRLIGL